MCLQTQRKHNVPITFYLISYTSKNKLLSCDLAIKFVDVDVDVNVES